MRCRGMRKTTASGAARASVAHHDRGTPRCLRDERHFTSRCETRSTCEHGPSSPDLPGVLHAERALLPYIFRMTAPTTTDPLLLSVFPGTSDMAVRCRAFDWEATALGAVSGWPVALRTIVRTALESPFPTN